MEPTGLLPAVQILGLVAFLVFFVMLIRAPKNPGIKIQNDELNRLREVRETKLRESLKNPDKANLFEFLEKQTRRHDLKLTHYFGQDLGFDSLDEVELCMKMEDHLGIELTALDTSVMVKMTVAQVIDLVYEEVLTQR
jgi:acyl carrier protein